MKNSTILNNTKNNQLSYIFLILLVSMLPNFLQAQDYRYINAYMDDFGKNEMFVKKSLMDYSVTIVDSQIDTRSKATSGKIVDKLVNMNLIMKNTNKGFENNTLLRDSFIKMNEKTIECLKNGSLILDDYDYQSMLSFSEINANMSRKEKDMASYYQEIKNYDANKKAFGMQYNVSFKANAGKNVLEYNGFQNILFYKINVIDQKLTTLIAAKDKAGFAECFKNIDALHLEAISRTNQYKDNFKDNSMNDANMKYSNFIYGQKEKLFTLFNDFVDEYAILLALKNSTKPQTPAFIAAYNQQARIYNSKKNLFYAVLNPIQVTKKAMYNSWFVTNSKFLQNNSEFENIHDKYSTTDTKVAVR
ncbi:MAG: hypothetical protein H7199_07965 [Burkholderiales bacterium]|nr:hypothetical protein [Flavobacterium sp.]